MAKATQTTRDKRGQNSGITVKRGEQSWAYFPIASGIISMILIEIIDKAKFIEGYKVVLILSNILIILYLCFFNGWFRNKIVGLFSKSKNLWERF